jgi:myo-inositol 2-dehydrogenase/D-chiro-inositol 1-dehydrogenase
MGAERRLRCAVLGSGFAGSTFAESISYAPDAELVAIAGGRNAPLLAQRFATRALPTTEVDALLDSDAVDAVLIASPNPAHCPQALRAAASGKHVLVEKPMALNVGECRAMIDACQRAGVVLMVGHHHRFRRNPIAAQLLLERGAIGKVDLVQMLQTEPDVTTWLTTPANGGYLLGGGVHGLDLLRWWLGDVERVCALTGEYRGVHVENGSLLLLEFANAAHASFGYSVIPGSVPPPGSGVVQFEARLTGQTGAMHVDMYGDVKLSTPTGWDVQTTLPAWQGHYAFLRMEAYASQAREFVGAIREHRPPRYAAEEALRAVAIVEAAHLSARDRRWVRIQEILDAA